MRATPLLALTVSVALLTAAGCGGSTKSSSKSPSENESTPAATTTAAETPAATTAAASTTKSSSSSSSNANKTALAKCPELAQLGAKFSAALQAASASAQGDPGKAAQNTASVFDHFADDAPAELRGDLEVYAKVLKSYAVVIAKTHFEPGKAPTAAQIAALTKASQAFSGPELQKASTHLSTWMQSHCGSGFGK